MGAKKLADGDYQYKGYLLKNHGYYPPDKAIWWEAVNKKTGFSEFHENTKRSLMCEIDKFEN